MSRSNPQGNAPNPAVRWFEWNGEHGAVRFFDREKKQAMECALPFTFLVLDELASVRGWHDQSDSGIYSNEVRDTRTDLLVVKAFKGGTIAEGLYKDIKDRANSAGGQFVTNCYIAFKNGGGKLSIGSLRLKGAALNAWVDFRKANRSALYEGAISITKFTEGKKGRITFRVPTFEAKAISSETQAEAVGLDRELQAWLEGYFKRKTSDQSDAQRGDDSGYQPEPEDNGPPVDDDIPF
jgi:hypothetical protein